MCGRFEALTMEELEEVIRSVEAGLADGSDSPTRDFAPSASTGAVRTVTPGAVAPVIVPSSAWAQSNGTCCGGGCGSCPWTKKPLALEPVSLTWGFPVDWQKGRVFNTRIEHAGETHGMWAESLANRRCIVPARAFFEPHRAETIASPRTGRQVKRQYAFRPSEADAATFPWLLMAGVFSGDSFSVVTTRPNDQMEPIHDRMPLVLRPDEVATWLSPRYDQLADRSEIRLNAQPELADIPSVKQLSLF